MTYRRFIRVVEQPAQQTVLEASHGMYTRLPVGHEVQVWHHGEDGEVFELHDLRGAVFLDQDWGHLSDFQDWYLDELVAQSQH